MNHMNHTPGPWRKGQGNWVESDARGYVAGNIGESADVHLIAAAPDVLEALRRAERFISDELDCREQSCLPEPNASEEEYLTDARGTLEVVQAAIAKAEGRS